MLSNRLRDRRNARRLRSKGWKALRFWEHALRKEKGRNQVLLRLRQSISAQMNAEEPQIQKR
jgi:G:T-mismatch repair DNA endonuclease (very short patch repair protein)